MTSGITRGHRGVKAELPPSQILPEIMNIGFPQPQSNTKHPFQQQTAREKCHEIQCSRSSSKGAALISCSRLS